MGALMLVEEIGFGCSDDGRWAGLRELRELVYDTRLDYLVTSSQGAVGG